MSLRSFSPEGGDLGYPEPYPDPKIPFPVHAAKAAKLLTLTKALADVSDLDLHFCYSFMLPLEIDERKMTELTRQITLPHDVTWYTVDGRKLFEMRGPSGGIASSKCCYLITLDR